MNLPYFILLEQTGKDKRLPLFTCHTSIKTVNARMDWMDKNQFFLAMNTFKKLIGILGFYTAGQLKNSQIIKTKEFLSATVEITVNLDFWCSCKSKNNAGKLFPRSSFRDSCKACYEVVWGRQLVLLTEKKSYTDAWIAALNGCIAYICNYSQLSLLRTP